MIMMIVSWGSRFISFVLGFLAHIRWPFSLFLIRWFCRAYKVQTEEAEKEITKYPSLGEFFIRKLKEGSRPIEEGVVHPVDGKIVSCGQVERGTLFQAKSITYLAQDFLKKELPSDLEGGSYFNYYLAPHNYHRVHSPVSGRVTQITNVSGALWPVKPYFMENIPDLLVRNKRVLFFIEEETTQKQVVVAMVGALNVGSLWVSVLEEQEIKKGEELGIFRMGSTVIVIYPKELQNFKRTLGEVRMGESLA